jgi:Flp pilus assembly protein protease CpaA
LDGIRVFPPWSVGALFLSVSAGTCDIININRNQLHEALIQKGIIHMKWTIAMVLQLLVFLCGAIPAAINDMKRLRIPRAIPVCVILCLVVLDALFSPWDLAADTIAAALAFLAFFAVKYLVGGLGAGDLKYAAMISFFAGLPYCFIAILAAALSVLLYFGLVAAFVGIKRSTRIPFAPFLTGGALLAWTMKHLLAD